MACRLLHLSPLPWPQLLILGATVQLIYAVDHLWDARRMHARPVTGRHWFHWRFRRLFTRMVVVQMVILAVAALLFFPKLVIAFGGFLAGLVGVYLLIVHAIPKKIVRQWFPKEVVIAGLYTVGIWGSPGVLTSVNLAYWLLAVVFGLLALQNLLVFSMYERAQDLRQQQPSAVHTWGSGVTRMVLILSWLLTVAGLTYIWQQNPAPLVHYASITEGIMAAGLLVIYAFPAYFGVNERYRWLGDALFILPIWALWSG